MRTKQFLGFSGFVFEFNIHNPIIVIENKNAAKNLISGKVLQDFICVGQLRLKKLN